MKKLLKSIAYVIFFIVLIVLVNYQTTTENTKTTTENNKTTTENNKTTNDNGKRDTYLGFSESFDIDANNIGPNFKGHDFVEVGKLLVEKNYLLKLPYKDEFETGEQYLTRIAEYNPEKELFGTTNAEHFLAFSPDDIQYSAIKYDADNEELKILVETTHNSLNKTFTTNRRNTSETNAFVASVNVIYTDEVEYSLELHHFNSTKKFRNDIRKLSGHKRDLTFNAITPKWTYYDPGRNLKTTSDLVFSRVLKLPLEKAKQIKSDLRVVIITKLQSPYLIETYLTAEPTMKHPYAGERSEIEIIGQIEQIWLYDSTTGDVIKKWPEQSSLRYMCHYESNDC